MSDVFILITSEQVRGTDFSPTINIRAFDDGKRADAAGRRLATRSAKNGVTAWYKVTKVKIERRKEAR